MALVLGSLAGCGASTDGSKPTGAADAGGRGDLGEPGFEFRPGADVGTPGRAADASAGPADAPLESDTGAPSVDLASWVEAFADAGKKYLETSLGTVTGA